MFLPIAWVKGNLCFVNLHYNRSFFHDCCLQSRSNVKHDSPTVPKDHPHGSIDMAVLDAVGEVSGMFSGTPFAVYHSFTFIFRGVLLLKHLNQKLKK